MNVPKLRFKEFNDNWKSYKLSDLVEFYKGNLLAKSDLDDNGKYPCILYGQLYTKYKEVIRIIESKTNRDEKNIPRSKKGDVLIPSSGETPIDISTSSCIQSDNVLLGGDINILRPINCDGRFLSYTINNNKKTEIARVAQGHSVVHLYIDNLKYVSINVPSIKEQNKIADALELLDKKIELQNKKIEDLKLFKKGLLIKEFNNKKCNNKLKECFDFGKAGGTPKSTNKNYYNGYIPFLSISDMTTQGKYIYYTDKSITEAGLNNSTAWLVPKNSIIISMYASYGLVSINKIDLTTSQAMFNMVINKNYVVEYIYYYLYYLYISNFYNSIVLTGTQSNLNAEQIKLLDIYIPCYNEQKRIYEQFSKIDFKINLEQKKINELLYLKKGLMQNMFV